MVNHEKPEQPWKNFYQHFRFQLGRDSPSDARETLLIVTTLIVAVTFQAGVNPPGGVWQDNSYRKAGESILAEKNRVAYCLFLFGNTLAFSAATNAILYLTLGCPFQLEVLIAVYSINFTYGVSVSAVAPSGIFTHAYLYVAFFLPYCFRSLSEFIRRQRCPNSSADSAAEVN